MLIYRYPFTIGTDHQRIAKLDRENEVAPPAKISPTVGKVRYIPLFYLRTSRLIILLLVVLFLGYANSADGAEVDAERCRCEDQREA